MLMLDIFPPWVIYVWLPIRHLISLAIMYGIYTYAHNDFERLMICSIVILYVVIAEFSRAWGLSHVLAIGFYKHEIEKLKKIMTKDVDDLKARYNLPEYEWEKEFEQEEMQEFIDKVRKVKTCSTISEICLSFIFTFALLGILKILIL
ncbi:MAG: hypothetical protein ABSF52_06590 [Syntrophobacteraceae bacterium]